VKIVAGDPLQEHVRAEYSSEAIDYKKGALMKR
jgi:hypothetical protein